MSEAKHMNRLDPAHGWHLRLSSHLDGMHPWLRRAQHVRGRALFPCVLTVWLDQVWRGPIGKEVPRLLSEEAGAEGKSCMVSSPSYLAPSLPVPPQPGGAFLSSLLGVGSAETPGGAVHLSPVTWPGREVRPAMGQDQSRGRRW